MKKKKNKNSIQLYRCFTLFNTTVYLVQYSLNYNKQMFLLILLYFLIINFKNSKPLHQSRIKRTINKYKLTIIFSYILTDR